MLGDIASQSDQYDIGIVLRNTDPGNGGFGGYTVFWSAYGDGRGAADAFITVDKPGANILYEENVPVPTPGTHTLGAAVLGGGVINVYVDGVLTATVVDPAPLAPGNAGLDFGWTGSPPGLVWITTFAEGLHQVDSMTVTLQKDDAQLSPIELASSGGSSDFSGQPVQTQMQLRVSVDSSGIKLPNRSVTLSVAAVDSAGGGIDGPYGHYHRGAGGAQKPAGSVSPITVNTGPSRVATATYRTGPISGPVILRAESQGAKSRVDTVHVGVLGLVPLSPRYSDSLVGSSETHPAWANHWGLPSMVQRLNLLADAFYSEFHRKIWFNDLSLPLGGRYDFTNNWGYPHDEHRAGRDLDLKTDPDGREDLGGMTEAQRTWVWEFWEFLGGTVGDERYKTDKITLRAQPHYHLRYRGAN